MLRARGKPGVAGIGGNRVTVMARKRRSGRVRLGADRIIRRVRSGVRGHDPAALLTLSSVSWPWGIEHIRSVGPGLAGRFSSVRAESSPWTRCSAAGPGSCGWRAAAENRRACLLVRRARYQKIFMNSPARPKATIRLRSNAKSQRSPGRRRALAGLNN